MKKKKITTRPSQGEYFDGLVQECSVSSALAMETLQSCPKLST